MTMTLVKEVLKIFLQILTMINKYSFSSIFSNFWGYNEWVFFFLTSALSKDANDQVEIHYSLGSSWLRGSRKISWAYHSKTKAIRPYF